MGKDGCVIQDWVNHLKDLRKSEDTLKGYGYVLKKFSEYLLRMDLTLNKMVRYTRDRQEEIVFNFIYKHSYNGKPHSDKTNCIK